MREKGYKNKIKNASKIIKKHEEITRCSICSAEYNNYGNNAQPVNEGRCCDKCNSEVVVLKRIENILNNDKY